MHLESLSISVAINSALILHKIIIIDARKHDINNAVHKILTAFSGLLCDVATILDREVCMPTQQNEKQVIKTGKIS